ncbi:MAG: cadmium-translocating P-type ATPase [Spirochaetes bacterium]|nr:cadmium-translocating P-type ATPase [Spirochaetota bacterium]MBU1080022.1 cadmium-translocating P-type ATPase [Spirochaetota bacterium]
MSADIGRECGDDGEACCASCAAHEKARAEAFKAGPADGKRRLSRETRLQIASLAAASAIAVGGYLVQAAAGLPGAAAWLTPASTLVFAAAYLLAGRDVLLAAAKNVARGRVFDELFLMSIASLGAFAIGAMEEAIGVMVFYKVGEMLQEGAADESRRSIRSLLAMRPDKARVSRDGQWVDCLPEDVVPGDLVLVRPGERVPVDGIVVEGAGSFDTSSMTGESAPRAAGAGDDALSGFIALDAAITLRAERPASESSAARIVALVENASKAKARTELFITRFAKWYTPAVVVGALLVAIAPPLLVPGQRFADWAYRALVMLVISCPCAFVISVPLGYFGGLGGAAKRGILIKGASVLDALADAGTVVFDKTGTLTDGSFSVREISPADGFDEESLLGGAVAAETHSNHPLAVAIRDAWASTGKPRPVCDDGSYSEIPGHGAVALVGGRRVIAGGDRLLHIEGVPHECRPAAGTEIHIAIAGRYAGRIGVGDALKSDGKSALERLRGLGVRRIAMLTGDSGAAADRVAAEAGIDEVHHGLLPEGKLERLEAILGQEKGRGSVLFVGDGVNDAPVLARADAGIAMGGGSDAAVESADVVLMSGEPSRVAEAVERAKRTRRIVTQNIAFALGVKLAFLGLGALGMAAMWEAVIADVGVALLAVLNSSRALR